MRNGCVGLVAAAIVSIVSTSGIVSAAEDEGDQAAITIIGSPSLLPEGSRCTIELKPEENDREAVETTYQGKVTRTTGEVIMLSEYEERRCATLKSPIADIPYLNRLVRNIGIRKPSPGEEATVSIPVEKIRSVRCYGNPAEG